MPNLAKPATRIDVTGVVRLRRRVSRAATSLKIIGFVSAVPVLFWLSDAFGFAGALLCATVTFGVASVIAMRLRAGSHRAAAVAAIWGFLWCGLFAFDALPKALKNGVDLATLAGMSLFFFTTLFLAIGLLALIRYRPSATDADAYLLTHPWEVGLRIIVRPRLLRLNIGAVLLIVLSPLPFVFLRASQLVGDQQIVNSSAEQSGAFIAALIFTLGVVAWGAKIYRRARRSAMLPGSALVKKDPRPIVLYLRSFQDDAAFPMRARATNGRILAERLVRVSFEEVVTDHLWGYGPVLAIGDPLAKEKDAPLGAARNFASDSDWQKHVTQLMSEAAFIVAVAGKTAGLAWELEAVVNGGFLSKLMLLLPPADSKEVGERVQALAGKTGSFNLASSVQTDRLRAVTFAVQPATLIYADGRDDWTYEVVLDQAALSILGSPESRPATSLQPARSQRAFLPTLAVFVRSALTFLALGVLILVNYGANLFHSQSSHPFRRAGQDRDDFVAQVIEGCRSENLGLAEDVRGKYCSCYANQLADTVTNAETLALEDSKSVVGSIADLKASFERKVDNAAKTCARTLR